MVFEKLVGLFMPLFLGTIRYRSLLLQLPVVALVPVYFALVFGLGVEKLAYILAGAVVSSGVWISNAMIQDVVYERETYKYLDMLIASPASPLLYVVAHILFAYIIAIIPTLPIAALYAWLTGSLEAIPWSLVIVFLLSLSLSALSIAVGLRFRNIREVGTFPSLVSTLLVFVPPVYYPASILPDSIAKASLLVPSASAAEALRGLVQGASLVNPYILIGYLGLVALVSIIYLAYRFDWSLG